MKSYALKVMVCNREGNCVPARTMPDVIVDGFTAQIMDDDIESIFDAIQDAAAELELNPKDWEWRDNFDMKKQRGRM